MATTTTSAVRASLPRTVADKPAVHVLVSGIGTANADYTTTALTAADAAQDKMNTLFVNAINSILSGLKTLGLFETISG
jgi:hypothetical protein